LSELSSTALGAECGSTSTLGTESTTEGAASATNSELTSAGVKVGSALADAELASAGVEGRSTTTTNGELSLATKLVFSEFASGTTNGELASSRSEGSTVLATNSELAGALEFTSLATNGELALATSVSTEAAILSSTDGATESTSGLTSEASTTSA
jgi:hypothetical protein